MAAVSYDKDVFWLVEGKLPPTWLWCFPDWSVPDQTWPVRYGHPLPFVADHEAGYWQRLAAVVSVALGGYPGHAMELSPGEGTVHVKLGVLCPVPQWRCCQSSCTSSTPRSRTWSWPGLTPSVFNITLSVVQISIYISSVMFYLFSLFIDIFIQIHVLWPPLLVSMVGFNLIHQ